jgi:hypothetical protein
MTSKKSKYDEYRLENLLFYLVDPGLVLIRETKEIGGINNDIFEKQHEIPFQIEECQEQECSKVRPCIQESLQ